MPRRNLSVLSKEEDPYTLNRFPREFAVTIGKQTYNARQLAKAAKVKGQYLDMYRQPIPAAKVREILALTGQRPHANAGRFIPASQLAKLRKLAKRELLARQGKSVVGPMQYRATGRPTAPRPTRTPHRYRPVMRSSAPIGQIRSDRRAAWRNGVERSAAFQAWRARMLQISPPPPLLIASGLSYGDLRAMTDERLMGELERVGLVELGTRSRR
jgi:hypothetical protein